MKEKKKSVKSVKSISLTMAIAAGVAIAAGAAGVAMAAPKRGADGQLQIAFWQEISTLNPFKTTGSKDGEAQALVLEPLAYYDETGQLRPTLATEIPTEGNGGVSADLKSITWKLRTDITWSDGTPFTSEDLIFSYEYCINTLKDECPSLSQYKDIASLQKLDTHTVRVNFTAPKSFPYGPFAFTPIVQKAQFQTCLGPQDSGNPCLAQDFVPIGTGPFQVADFKPRTGNNTVMYEANPHYRDPDKPAFATVLLMGGGDALSAMDLVFNSDVDFAWNTQVDPSVLENRLNNGPNGQLLKVFGSFVEQIEVNLSNPDLALGGQRSTVAGGPHPFLTDPNIIKAMSLAIDRQALAQAGYGPTGKATCNLVVAPELYASPTYKTCPTQNLIQANSILKEAGWKRGNDGIRTKDGVRLSVLFQTSENAVRQETQRMIKEWWEIIGIETKLHSINAGLFFGGDPATTETMERFYADLQMFTAGNGVDPELYMIRWLCSEIPSPDNNWQGQNNSRFCHPDYEALVAQLAQTKDLDQRAQLVMQMNDLLIEEGVVIPLIHRAGVSVYSRTLGGVEANPWALELRGIADWYRIQTP